MEIVLSKTIVKIRLLKCPWKTHFIAVGARISS